MRLLALALLTCSAQAAANGPAWVAELSDTSPAKADVLAVTVPLGSHVAVGVYNTDAVAPEPPAGVAAVVRVQWFEHRTVFAGMAEEREAAVPYYLPERKDCAPTGAWVVELTPQAEGIYTVPIACNTNTVTVRLTCIALPASDVGYGFYTDSIRYPTQGIEAERAYMADMAAHGMNTFTPYARELGPKPWDYAKCLADRVNVAAEVGLADVRFPLVVLALEPKDINRAPAFATCEWPELVGYNYDEPAVEKGPEVAEYAARWHDVGRRTGTAIEAHIAKQIGAALDVWILHMDGMSAEAVQIARDAGKSRWMYNCALRGSNAALHRYWTGVYTWAMAPEVCLTWTYCHDPASRILPDGTWNLLRVYDTATCDRDGKPLPTVALEGMQEGIIDSRLLQELARRSTPEGNAYLDSLRAQVDWGFWPLGRGRDYSTSYVWDVPDTAVPPVDMVAMRGEVLRLLGVAQ